MKQEADAQSPQFNSQELFREDTFTDRRVGTIRRLTPVTAEGEVDPSRQAEYAGMAQVMTAAGPMPLNFDIPGNSLDEACANFAACAEQAVEEMAQRLEEMRREQASQIVLPGQGKGGSGLIGV